MVFKSKAPCGSWKSPITSNLITSSQIKLSDLSISDDGIFWNELRPQENGRSLIVKWYKNKKTDFLPSGFSARSRVHEYGGGAFLIHKEVAFFSNEKDQHFYAAYPNGQTIDLTHSDSRRYANPIFDPYRNCIYAIEEDHQDKHTVINRLVKIDPEGKQPVEVVHEGHDFYSSPTLHPEGTHIAFLAWNHPNMPWDGTELLIGLLDKNSKILEEERVAGGCFESIFQPEWSPSGCLHFVSDKNGWWNLYVKGEKGITNLCPVNAEFGTAQWIFGISRYAFLPNGKIACIYTKKGIDYLGILDPQNKEIDTLPLGFTSFSSIKALNKTLIFTAASPQTLNAIWQYDLEKQNLKLLQSSLLVDIDPTYLSIPETIDFLTTNKQDAFGLYYNPKNKDFTMPDNEKPPLIVRSHGGPSTHIPLALDLEVQFWTSRGFAVLDVNYGGSTGYGRQYRQRLKGNWGIVDVDDCVNGALHLVKNKQADPKRLIIKGRSAGGFTTLVALAFKKVFTCGASYYGISDLEAMTNHTHKFESHYLEGLIGAYPEKKNRYIKRSPIHHMKNFSSPIILFQGGKDKVVPKIQSEMIFNCLKKRNIPVTYLFFKEEAHGFRIAKNIQKCLESELFFYSKIFHLKANETLPSVPINNSEALED